MEASSPWEGKLIQYASRPLEAGEPALVLDKREHRADTWLVLSASPLPEELNLPAGLAVAARTDASLLLTVQDEPLPFLESEARARLANTEALAERITPRLREDLRIYSLADAETFGNALPRLALILVLFLAPAFLLPPLFLARAGRCRRVLLAINGLLIALIAAALYRETASVTLPASLLPVHTILDFRHYARKLGQILPALEALAESSAASTVSSTYASARLAGIGIAAAGVSLSLAVLGLELFVSRIAAKRRN